MIFSPWRKEVNILSEKYVTRHVLWHIWNVPHSNSRHVLIRLSEKNWTNFPVLVGKGFAQLSGQLTGWLKRKCANISLFSNLRGVFEQTDKQIVLFPCSFTKLWCFLLSPVVNYNSFRSLRCVEVSWIIFFVYSCVIFSVFRSNEDKGKDVL